MLENTNDLSMARNVGKFSPLSPKSGNMFIRMGSGSLFAEQEWRLWLLFSPRVGTVLTERYQVIYEKISLKRYGFCGPFFSILLLLVD